MDFLHSLKIISPKKYWIYLKGIKRMEEKLISTIYAMSLHELRDLCRDSICRNKIISSKFSVYIMQAENNWEADWASMCHLSKENGAAGIEFEDFSVKFDEYEDVVDAIGKLYAY